MFPYLNKILQVTSPTLGVVFPQLFSFHRMLSEQDEYKALAYVLQGNESEEFELQEVQLQPLPDLQAVDDQFESEDPGAQSEEKERNKRYVDISLQDTWYFLNFSHFIVLLYPVVEEFHVRFCLVNSVLICIVLLEFICVRTVKVLYL
jgi:D-mannonate dehydratase